MRWDQRARKARGEELPKKVPKGATAGRKKKAGARAVAQGLVEDLAELGGPLAKLAGVERVRSDSSRYLRHAAFLRYVSDPEMSAEGLRALPQFSGVPAHQLRSWCTSDGWVEARERQFALIRTAVLKDVAEGQLKSHLRNLDELGQVKSAVLKHLLEETRLAGVEGDKLARVYVQILHAEYEIREHVAPVVAPPPTPGPGPVHAPAVSGAAAPLEVLTDDEARAVAQTLLQLRQRKEEAATAAVEDAETTPSTRG